MKKYISLFMVFVVSGLLSKVAARHMDMQEKEEQYIFIERDKNKTKIEKDIKVVVNGEGVFINDKPAEDFEIPGLRIRIGKYCKEMCCEESCCNEKNKRKLEWKEHHSGRYPPKTDMKEKPYLGIMSVPNEKGKGMVIKKIIPKSAASEAGLQVEDVILKMDNTEVKSFENIVDIVKSKKVGEKVAMTYLRDGKQKNAEAILKDWKEFDFDVNVDFSEVDMSDILGHKIKEKLRSIMDDDHLEHHFGKNEERPRLGMDLETLEFGKGLKVISVEEKSHAEQAGLKINDIITHLDGKEINHLKDFSDGIRSSLRDNESQKIELNIQRDKSQQKVIIGVPRKKKKMSF